ncbi:MAG: biotin carboxylase N-terminal domain-containing protein [Alphaproteobacteria bacterium]|jgi:3-methylcrotonyl-CoA carboxylase alpha subunit|nr:biotin carboxylase N-terminal domain-containing protein [Alphaproteobacteria bacterium]MDP6814661.1 biotin carboxylase N-terminal domain-containing protein [Alphaproteobacteria bacterium]
MFGKLLIANRGDSACRIARSCRRLGIPMATVHSDFDRRAAHVRLIGESIRVGPAPAADSYLDIDAILRAAAAVGADAIHPGIGFLSESAEFAEAVEAAGLVFVGPTAETLREFGDKNQAKVQAAAAEIPVIPGGPAASADPAELAEMIAGMAPPVLLKAAGGGGGRGVRVLEDTSDPGEAIASAMREAQNAFGRADLLVERYLAGARHVEVQLAGDGSGDVVHLFDRDCSLQRRHQKVVEEAPAPNLPEALRQAILDAACRLGARARLRGLATVEFLVRGEAFFFLEVNPRLQVEHPVTEMLTGLDLVAWQLRIAAGGGLPLAQDRIPSNGHAMQVRIYAEDPADGFAPTTGSVRRIDLPGGEIRADLGIGPGETIGPHYDAMIGKLVCHGTDRAAALEALRAALPATTILGLPTNLHFLEELLAEPAVLAGSADTGLIDRRAAAAKPEDRRPADHVFAVAGGLALLAERDGPDTDPWTRYDGFTNWRLGRGGNPPGRQPALVVEIDGASAEVAFSAIAPDGGLHVRVGETGLALTLEDMDGGHYLASFDETVLALRALLDGGTIYLSGPFGAATAHVTPYVRAADAAASAVEGRLLAPVMGQVTKVRVAVGDRVSAGDIIIIQESMKMELRLTAPCDGVVAELACGEGDMIERHSFVAEVRPLDQVA